ncbi:hypothetical protein PR048_008989 [Dryococelus australis]|uniref:Uncharacterized protein n=1 Tax=Dryococelus australis TaxID=614101 RepID=A0ABQ9HYM5_9NEOP|nr:hypothetical protein PR048_008989 [Dryococelus australis]
MLKRSSSDSNEENRIPDSSRASEQSNSTFTSRSLKGPQSLTPEDVWPNKRGKRKKDTTQILTDSPNMKAPKDDRGSSKKKKANIEENRRQKGMKGSFKAKESMKKILFPPKKKAK